MTYDIIWKGKSSALKTLMSDNFPELDSLIGEVGVSQAKFLILDAKFSTVY
jgi:hypothetical protein